MGDDTAQANNHITCSRNHFGTTADDVQVQSVNDNRMDRMRKEAALCYSMGFGKVC